MPKLYDLLTEFGNAYDAAIEAADDDGLIPPEWASRLAAVEYEFDEKIQAYGRLIRSLSAYREAVHSEAATLARRAATLDRRVDALKDAVKAAMQAAGKTRVIGVPTVTLVQNSAPSVVVEDQEIVPAEYWTDPAPVLSKSKIAAALAAGTVTVPGCRLERGFHVRVK